MFIGSIFPVKSKYPAKTKEFASVVRITFVGSSKQKTYKKKTVSSSTVKRSKVSKKVLQKEKNERIFKKDSTVKNIQKERTVEKLKNLETKYTGKVKQEVEQATKLEAEQSFKKLSENNNSAVLKNGFNKRPESAIGEKSPIGVVYPDFTVNKKPIYPRIARLKGYEGTVYLRIKINGEGKVIYSTVEKSSGYDILDRSALKASLKWKFKPALKNGVPVVTTILVPVVFKLEN